jgi:hypothetical protein
MATAGGGWSGDRYIVPDETIHRWRQTKALNDVRERSDATARATSELDSRQNSMKRTSGFAC